MYLSSVSNIGLFYSAISFHWAMLTLSLGFFLKFSPKNCIMYLKKLLLGVRKSYLPCAEQSSQAEQRAELNISNKFKHVGW